jgi:hypothetical protein
MLCEIIYTWLWSKQTEICRRIDNIFGINFMLRLYCKEQLRFDNVSCEKSAIK